MIPKIIHYCWFGPKPLSDLEIKCLKSWKKNLPDYEIKLWNETNFNISDFQYACDAYKAEKFAFVADIARWYAIYKDGGIYLDTDMLVLKKLDSFLVDYFFTGYYRHLKFAAGILGGEKGNVIAATFLRMYRNMNFNANNLVIISDLMDNLLNKDNLIKKIKVYPPQYFYPFPFERRREDHHKYLSSESFAVHLWSHSWRDEFALLKNFLFLESLIMHFRKITNLPKEHMSFSYLKRYYHLFYRAFKKYIYLRLKAI